jgi:hypothetical protein
MTKTDRIEWALGRRFTLRHITDDKPGFKTVHELDFTVVSIDAQRDTCRVHVNDATKSRQTLTWSSLCDGIYGGTVVEMLAPALLHARQIAA